MINPFHDIDWKPGREALRKFAFSLVWSTPIFATLATGAYWLRHGNLATWPLWVGAIGVTAGAVFWVLPVLARPFYFVWFFVACCMGIVISNSLLVFFYYSVITPIGLILRLCGRDSMDRKPAQHRATFWRPAEPPAAPSRYFNQY